MAEIHPRLHQNELRFIPLGSSGDDLKKPFEEEWQKKANYLFDDKKLLDHIEHGGNYGVCGGFGDLHILDCDDLDIWEGLGILSLIPATFTVESRPGHRQYYIKCKNHFQSGGLFDPEKTELNDQGKPEYVHIGDLKAASKDGVCGGQAVGPSCKHPSGSTYQIVQDLAIAEVSREHLQSIIARFKTSKKVNTNYKRLDDDVTKSRQRKYTEQDPFDSLLVEDIMPPSGNITRSGDELRGDHPVHGSTNGGNYVINTTKNTWHCFRCESGGGPALAIAVKHDLMSCSDAQAGELRGDLFRHVLKIAKAEYLPHDNPVTTDGITVVDAIRALDGVCDHAISKDGTGFNKFDREEHQKLIEKAISEGGLSPKEEKKAYSFLKKYKKQLKELDINYGEIRHIPRGDTDVGVDLDEINIRIPEWIEEYHFKTVADTKRLYHYDHGVYLDDGERVLEEIIEAEYGEATNNKMVQDIIGKVMRRTYVDRDAFNSQRILNVRNGLLDLETLQLRPHTPDYLSTSQLGVIYDPGATCPRIQRFLAEVAQSGDIALIEEIIGWLLWPDYNVHKAVMLLGMGRNGKGTLLRLITALLGQKSISNVTLQELVQDRFAKADLYGKLANIGGDLPSKDLSDTAAFRNLTGGDDNRAQEKYRPAFSFRNKAKLMFSANVLPRSPDDTYAFYPRWILIEFLNIFDVQKGTGDPNLDAKLQTPEEISGLLNIALAGLKRLRSNEWRFSYDKTVEDVEVMYKRNANPVYAFLMDECEPGGATDLIEKTTFANRFNEYVRKHNLRPVSSTKFGELLKDQTEIPVSTLRQYVAYGDRPWCWQGIKFKSFNWGSKPDSPYWGKGIAGIDSLSGEVSRPSTLTPTPSSSVKRIANENEEINKGRVGIGKTLDGLGSSEDSDHLAYSDYISKKRTCIVCHEVCSHDLIIHYLNGYICAKCQREGRTFAAHKEKVVESIKKCSSQTELEQIEEQNEQRTQPEMGNIADIAEISNAANMEKINSESTEEIIDDTTSTLDIMAMKPISTTMIYLGSDNPYWGQDITWEGLDCDIHANLPPKYSYEVQGWRRIEVAIASGIIDPFKLAEAAGIPVCVAAKWPGVNSITAADVLGKLEEHRRDRHFGELADRLMTRPKEGAKKIHSLFEMASWVPPDNSSPEAAKIGRAFCALLKKGDAPRVDLLVKTTGLPEEKVQAYLDGANWIRIDDSSQGNVVYLPLEASA